MDDQMIKNPLVVGYKGEIGSFILQGLLRIMPKALNIDCFDVSETTKECGERILRSDVIFLCVPLENTPLFFMRWFKELQGKIVIEQTSIKSMLFEKKDINSFLKGIDIWSMHILFRPSLTPNRSDRKVALIRDNKPWYKLQHEIEQITESETFFFKTYKEHDKAMSLQQTLTHRVLLVLDEVVRVEGCDTYITKKVSELVDRIKSGNPKLYAQIQQSKYGDKVVNEFINKLKEFKTEE